jgi:hypothetical protein
MSNKSKIFTSFRQPQGNNVGKDIAIIKSLKNASKSLQSLNQWETYTNNMTNVIVKHYSNSNPQFPNKTQLLKKVEKLRQIIKQLKVNSESLSNMQRKL